MHHGAEEHNEIVGHNCLIDFGIDKLRVYMPLNQLIDQIVNDQPAYLTVYSYCYEFNF